MTAAVTKAPTAQVIVTRSSAIEALDEMGKILEAED